MRPRRKPIDAGSPELVAQVRTPYTQKLERIHCVRADLL
jgi:hypothetical protein